MMEYNFLESTQVSGSFGADELEQLYRTIRLLDAIVPVLEAKDIPPLTAIRVCNISLCLLHNSYLHWASYPEAFTNAIADYYNQYGRKERAGEINKQVNALRNAPYYDKRMIQRYALNGSIQAFFNINSTLDTTVLNVITYASKESSKAAA